MYPLAPPPNVVDTFAAFPLSSVQEEVKSFKGRFSFDGWEGVGEAFDVAFDGGEGGHCDDGFASVTGLNSNRFEDDGIEAGA
jgi:hypothetical protein